MRLLKSFHKVKVQTYLTMLIVNAFVILQVQMRLSFVKCISQKPIWREYATIQEIYSCPIISFICQIIWQKCKQMEAIKIVMRTVS